MKERAREIIERNDGLCLDNENDRQKLIERLGVVEYDILTDWIDRLENMKLNFETVDQIEDIHYKMEHVCRIIGFNNALDEVQKELRKELRIPETEIHLEEYDK